MNTTNTEIYKRMFAESMIKRNCNNVITRSTTKNNESNESDNNEYNLSDGITCYFYIGTDSKLEFRTIQEIKYSCYPFDNDLSLSIIEIHKENKKIQNIGISSMLTPNKFYDSDDNIYSIENYTNLYYNDNDKKLYHKNENDRLEMIKRLPVIAKGFIIEHLEDEEILKWKKFLDSKYYNVYEDDKIIRYLSFCK